MRNLRETLVSYSDWYRQMIISEPNLSQVKTEFFQVSKPSADFDINSTLCMFIGLKYLICSIYPENIVFYFGDMSFYLLKESQQI